MRRKILYFFLLLSTLTSSVACGRNGPVKVSLAQLYRDPAAYNHKLIKMSGVISHGFEQFTLTDPNCPQRCGIWLEYGGKLASGTMYCCGVSAAREREESLIIDNIPIPLLQDEKFRKFDELLQGQPKSALKATIVGRFFAGEKTELGTETRWTGFGHFGCCSLLAIQEVSSIDE